MLGWLFGNSFKGWFGEQKTTFDMWLSLDDDVYKRFHDTIIPSANGTTQIDHIVVSRFGIFIVETKNKSGWIFGSEDQPNWTQSLYGKNYSFQNPLRQTYRQKKVLAQFLSVKDSNIRSIIYFAGDCRFRTQLPSNVLRSGLGSHIQGYREPVFSVEELNVIVQKLIQHKLNSPLSNSDHLRSLRERHNSTTNCPRCGGALKERVVKQGARAGQKFFGCTKYPVCRYTKDS